MLRTGLSSGLTDKTDTFAENPRTGTSQVSVWIFESVIKIYCTLFFFFRQELELASSGGL